VRDAVSVPSSGLRDRTQNCRLRETPNGHEIHAAGCPHPPLAPLAIENRGKNCGHSRLRPSRVGLLAATESYIR